MNDGNLHHRIIDSREAFVAALYAAVAAALAQRARRMVWVDAAFDAWPLDDAMLLQRMSDWLRLPQRRLDLLAHDYDTLHRRHPRFVAWYRLWSHAIDAASPDADDRVELPCLLLAEGVALVHLHDPPRWRGDASPDVASQKPWRELIDAVLQRSAPAFPATTLGL